MTKKIEILIVIAILLVLAFVIIGCKDKAEAFEPEIRWGDSSLPDEPNEPRQRHIVAYDGIRTIFKCNGEIFSVIAGEGNISGDCPVCGEWIVTWGTGDSHKVKSYPQTKSLPEPNEPMVIWSGSEITADNVTNGHVIVAEINPESISDVGIKQLAESGRICKVLGGCKWRNIWADLPLGHCVMIDYNYETEYCIICGKHRSRSRQMDWGNWGD